jgi:hypothetical protein
MIVSESKVDEHYLLQSFFSKKSSEITPIAAKALETKKPIESNEQTKHFEKRFTSIMIIKHNSIYFGTEVISRVGPCEMYHISGARVFFRF